MPTKTIPLDPTARLTAARDEAMRRYAEHLLAVQLKTSKWSAAGVRRGRLPTNPAKLKAVTHAR